eukprot:scaffold17007_cov140-Isochrysis_galbana.AAC.2
MVSLPMRWDVRFVRPGAHSQSPPHHNPDSGTSPTVAHDSDSDIWRMCARKACTLAVELF